MRVRAKVRTRMNVSIRGWARVSANVRTRAEASLRPSRSGAGERISRSGCSERKRGGWARIKRAGGARAAGAQAQQRRSPTQAAMGAGAVEPQMALHELLHVFLEARDMLCVAQVDRVARPVPGGRQGWARGHWRVHGRPIPSEPQFPKSGRGRRTALNPRSAEGAFGLRGGDLGDL